MGKELSREGHRQRVKEKYRKSGFDGMADHNILELVLFYAIPRRDVKEIAYNLMNHFNGKINNVFEADIEELMKVDGIGENAAILINLFKNLNSFLLEKRNENVTCLDNFYVMKDYVHNILGNLDNERVIVITLDNSLNIINCKTVSYGTVNGASVEAKKIVECAIKDNAPYVILAHNHPKGSYKPSQNDVNFTIELRILLSQMNIKLFDHVIVGDDGTISMKNDINYYNCFED